jgi:hypothetical protein
MDDVDLDNTKKIDVEDLPECDVLEMDCEGAEKEILKKLQIKPRVIIVETHPDFESPPSEIKSILISMNYKVLKTIDRLSVPLLIAEIDK